MVLIRMWHKIPSGSQNPTPTEIHPMARKSIFCIATSRNQAEETSTKAPECALAGAGTGGVIGGTMGWIAGIGALAIPGAGFFIAAGPIIAALCGAAIGVSIGGIAGALIGQRIPVIVSKRHECRIQVESIFTSNHTQAGDATPPHAAPAKKRLNSRPKNE